MMGMPPKAMPMAAPNEEAAEGEAPSRGGSATDLIVGINGDLTKLVAMAQKAPGANPAAIKALSDALSSFQGAISQLTGKGEAPVGGAASMEAGANPNARPVG